MDQQIEADIVVVNDLLNEIAEINDYIAKAENVKPFSAVDLRDQRQAKLEQLSKYVDVTFVAMDPDFKKSLGRVDVILNNGADLAVELVDGSQITAAGKFEYDSEYRQLTWSAAPATAIPMDHWLLDWMLQQTSSPTLARASMTWQIICKKRLILPIKLLEALGMS